MSSGAAGPASGVEAPPGSGEADYHVGRRGRRTGRWAALAVAVVLALFVWVLATRPPALDRQTQSPLLGHAAPSVRGPSVTPAAFTSLDAWRGQWSIVNFFATWCVPCRGEHPQFVQFMARHQASGDVHLVMVVFDDTVPSVEDFFRTRGGDWPAVADPSGRVALDFGVSGVPETYLIDPGGVVVAKLVGGVTADGLDRLLAVATSRGA